MTAKAKINPSQFIRQVRQETSKVSWPSRKETITTAIVVMVMVFLAALFFLVVDQALSGAVKLFLGLGS